MDQESIGADDEGVAPTEDELRDVCGVMLRSWADAYSGVGSIELGLEDQTPDAVRFTIVFAFASHAHHVTTAAADLMAAGEYMSAIPLLRVGYESALTAAWAAQSEDAARALQNEYIDMAKKLHRSASRTGWFGDQLTAPEEALVEVAPTARGEAGNFFNMCNALEPHSEWLYTMYRLLSAYSHPSGTVLRAYAPGEAGDAVSLTPEPMNDTRSWWHAASMNLLHAGQALDRLDRASRRRGVLSEAGELIGWPDALKLTSAAVAKVREHRLQREASG